jgi:hypothetical protein
MTTERRVLWVWACLAVAACLLAPQSGIAYTNYLPLDPGFLWMYQGVGGNEESMSVTGTRTLFGETVSVMDVFNSTSNEPLKNYWRRAEDGDVLLCGFFRDEDGGWGLAYDPPIRWVDAPVVLGATWACTTQVYELPGMIPADVMVVEYTVWWEGTLPTPAGEFPSIGIGFANPWMAGSRFRGCAPDGRVLSGRSEPDRWLSDWVGLVQYVSDDLYQLYYWGIVPVEPLTWSRVKMLYRGSGA